MSIFLITYAHLWRLNNDVQQQWHAYAYFRLYLWLSIYEAEFMHCRSWNFHKGCILLRISQVITSGKLPLQCLSVYNENISKIANFCTSPKPRKYLHAKMLAYTVCNDTENIRDICCCMYWKFIWKLKNLSI